MALVTVLLSVIAGLGFRRPFRGSAVAFYLAIASLIMPGLFVGLGIALTFRLLGLGTNWFTSGLGAQLTWTLPFGLLIMFAVLGRFNRSYEEAATDLGATPWQRMQRGHLAHAAARHHRRRAVRLHAVLRRVRPHRAHRRQRRTPCRSKSGR